MRNGPSIDANMPRECDHAYSPDCRFQQCWDQDHDCDVCRCCELKPGCQTEPNFGCQTEEKQRRGRLSPPCRLCGERTPIVFNIRFKAVSVCQACAIAITRQEVASRGRRDAEPVMMEIVDTNDAYHPQSPHWGSMVSPVAQRAPSMSPWLDCPTCPKCDLPVAIADHEAGPLGLFCPACGERWNGAQEDRAIADRADLAWQQQVQEFSCRE